MSRKEFPASVRKAKVIACADADGVVHCEGCGKALRQGQWHFDHDLPDGLGGKNDYENCRLLCCGPGSCHAIKTELDKALMQKADNIKHFHEGTRAAPKAKIPSRPKVERPPRRLAESLPELPKPRLFR